MIDFKKKIEEEERREGRLAPDSAEIESFVNNKKRKRIVSYVIAIIVIALVFSGRILISSQNGTHWFPGIEVWDKLRHLVPSADNKLRGEDDDRINILLLGMGGEGHDGAYLTDTIILASFQPSTKQAAMLSIPRDLVAPVSNWRKINSINAYAEQKTPGSGGTATAQAISELLQTPIPYYVRADFNGFSRVIDQLGGIDINVENVLDDYSYPIYGQEDNPNYYARFEHLHFDKGWQHMNGETALKYTRSRHAVGTEGSDFARARRQQLVLEAVKNKLFSTRTLLNPVMITKLANELSKNISTNLSAWEMLRLWDLFQEVDHSHIINKVLSDAPDNLLISGTGEDGAYILTPRSGNFAAVRNLVKNIFAANGVQSAPAKPEMISDGARVLILNGTWITGLAGKTAVTLEQSRFQILKIGNAPERNYVQTTVYDLSGGTKNASLAVLQRITAAKTGNNWPEWVKSYQTPGTTDSSSTGTATVAAAPDFIVVLGTDANQAE
ncbi:MAG: LCP family protein [Patescibacteria group bacterium]